jgi:DNA-binding NarL/FixJ family response regulator
MSRAGVASPWSRDLASPRRSTVRSRASGPLPTPGHDEPGPLVLWAAGPKEGAVPPGPQGFTVHKLDEVRTDVLIQALRELQPRVLVIDGQWCQANSRTALDELRRAAQRARWILAWHDVSWASVALLLDVDARAAVHHSAPPAVWVSAVTAVLDGQVWLPRGAERWLYAKALGARRRELQDSATSVLTEREAEVHGLLELGYTNKEIARQLDISPNTVKKHVAAVFEKGGLRSRRQVLG